MGIKEYSLEKISSIKKKARIPEDPECMGKLDKRIWEDERRFGIQVIGNGLIYHLEMNNMIVK